MESLLLSPPPLAAWRSSTLLLGHGQRSLAEIKQGADAVCATRMLPVVTGTDVGSLKQKGNLVAGDRGLRDSKEAARTDSERRQELKQLKEAKNHQAQQLSCSRTTRA